MPNPARTHRRRLVLLALLLTSLVLAACSRPTPPTPTFDLDVSLTGDGTGTITSSPTGIDTGAGANAASFDEDTVVTLTAAAAAGSAFVGFAGATACEAGSTATTCIVTMDADASVSAEFEAERFVVASSGIQLDALRFTAAGHTTSDTATLPGADLDPEHAIFGLAMHPTQPWLFVSSMVHQTWGEARIDVFEFSGGTFDHFATYPMVDFPTLQCVNEANDPIDDGCALTEMAFNPTGTQLYVNEDNYDVLATFDVDATTSALTFVDDSPEVSLQGITSHPSGPYLYNGLNVLEVVAGVPQNVGTFDYDSAGNGPMVLDTAAGLRLLTTGNNQDLILADLADPASPLELDRVVLTNNYEARFASADLASERAIVVGDDLATVFSFDGDALTDLGPTVLERLDPAVTRVFRGVAWVPGTDVAVATWFEKGSSGIGGYSVLEIADDGSVSIVAELPGAGRARAVLALP